MQYLREDVAAVWADRDPLEAAFALDGEVFRDVPGRRTMKVNVGGRDYFVKLHFGVGWLEIFKNWLQLKQPVVGARNEFEACQQLARAHLTAPVPAAYGQEGFNPARRRSFVMCDVLDHFESLEEVMDRWDDHPPDALTRHRYLYAVARFARRFHAAGFVHRDFYICHILVRRDDQERISSPAATGPDIELGVLDLHRAMQFRRLPDRWRKRDLAALLFSTLDLPFTRRDWLRFIRLYTGRPLRRELKERGVFWLGVLERANKLYREGERKGIVKGRYTS